MFEMAFRPGFSETDALGHINNTHLPVWFENAREPIFRLFTPDLDLTNWPLILAHMSVDFIGQIYFEKQVKITTEIAKLGNSSLTIKQSVWQDDCCVAVGLAVMVHFNYETNRSSPIPADVRVQLEKHLIQEVED
jgi:acyl-CoA thioester hydrolase